LIRPKIYLDICCFNRPYDDQSQLRIEIETKAKLFIQQLVERHEIDLVWSYMLDYENSRNIYTQKRIAIQEWQLLATNDINETPEIIQHSEEIQKTGIKNVDSLHIACAIDANCNYFISVDRRLLKYRETGIVFCDPIEFLRIWEKLKNDEQHSFIK